jgi:hypothetical protein
MALCIVLNMFYTLLIYGIYEVEQLESLSIMHETALAWKGKHPELVVQHFTRLIYLSPGFTSNFIDAKPATILTK